MTTTTTVVATTTTPPYRRPTAAGLDPIAKPLPRAGLTIFKAGAMPESEKRCKTFSYRALRMDAP